jgi:predicted CXXCH cytochrome family protein
MGTVRVLRVLLPAALLAVSVIGSPHRSVEARAAMAGSAEKPSIEILAPLDGAQVPPGKVLLIGRAKGGSFTGVEVDVNGKVHQKAVLSGGGFMASVYLTPGINVLTVHADGVTVERRIVASETVTYRYHPEAEKCIGCHAETAGGYVVSGRKDTLCYQCHDRMDARKQVHGPIGSGDCTTCHDPHGSANRALSVASPESLCGLCHDQASSGKHMKQSRGKACTDCHDPHASDKTFLQK